MIKSFISLLPSAKKVTFEQDFLWVDNISCLVPYSWMKAEDKIVASEFEEITGKFAINARKIET